MSTLAPSTFVAPMNTFSIVLNVCLGLILLVWLFYRKLYLRRFRNNNNINSETIPLLLRHDVETETTVTRRDVETNTDNLFSIDSLESLLASDPETNNLEKENTPLNQTFTPPSADSDESLLRTTTVGATAFERRQAFEAAFAAADQRKNLLMRTFKTTEQNTQTDESAV